MWTSSPPASQATWGKLIFGRNLLAQICFRCSRGRAAKSLLIAASHPRQASSAINWQSSGAFWEVGWAARFAASWTANWAARPFVCAGSAVGPGSCKRGHDLSRLQINALTHDICIPNTMGMSKCKKITSEGLFSGVSMPNFETKQC